MMYANKLVTCIKSNGKILREFKDAVYVPFGSEYSILVKNLNAVRALVNIQIDGVDATPGGLVVGSNQEIDLERSLKDGNLISGHSFKFIERTAGIENHRGVKADDGLIRVSFQYEKVTPAPAWAPYWWNGQWNGYPRLGGGPDYSTNTVGSAMGNSSPASDMIGETMSASPTKGVLRSASVNHVSASTSEVGITVPGSVSNQKFVTVKDFPLEAETHVMILRLLGETETGKAVFKPVTVKSKPKCVICGRVNKATSKFCVECGAALEII